MENVKRINKYLREHYGLAFDNNPKFRLVWSESQFEVRKGLFSPLAVFEEIRKVPKYTYIDNKWILEVYTLNFPGPFGRAIQHKAEIVMNSDGYEPLKVFQNKKREYLRPDLEICKIVCDQFSELVNRPEARRLTNKIASANDVIKMREEVTKFEELLGANDSDLLTKFRYQEAVVLPGKEF